MTVQRRKDTRTPRVFMHKVADIRGGVSVKVSELGGDFLNEGAARAPRQRHLPRQKIAALSAEATDTATDIKVNKGHNFKVGDFVMADEGVRLTLSHPLQPQRKPMTQSRSEPLSA